MKIMENIRIKMLMRILHFFTTNLVYQISGRKYNKKP